MSSWLAFGRVSNKQKREVEDFRLVLLLLGNSWLSAIFPGREILSWKLTDSSDSSALLYSDVRLLFICTVCRKNSATKSCVSQQSIWNTIVTLSVYLEFNKCRTCGLMIAASQPIIHGISNSGILSQITDTGNFIKLIFNNGIMFQHRINIRTPEMPRVVFNTYLWIRHARDVKLCVAKLPHVPVLFLGVEWV